MVEVKVLYSGLCGSDINKLRNMSNYKCVVNMGHEIVGNVTNTDSNRFNIGDTVVINPFICDKCNIVCKYESYMYCNQCKSLGKDVVGGFSGKVIVPDKNVYRLNVDREKAVVGVLVDAIAVIFHALHYFGAVNNVKECLIIGDGTLGCIAALVLNDLQENIHVNLLVRNNKKEELLNDIFYSTHVNFVKEEELELNSYDIVIEAVGGNQVKTIDMAIELVKNSSEIFVLGAFDNDINEKINLRQLFYKQIAVRGINSYCEEGNDFYKAVMWAEINYDYLMKFITKVINLSDIKTFLENYSSKSNKCDLKIVFKNNDHI